MSPVPDPVARYAPRVFLHPRDEIKPADPKAWLERARLMWTTGWKSKRTPVGGTGSAEDVLRLRSAPPPAFETWSATDFTRPFGEPARRPPGLGGRSGFVVVPDGELEPAPLAEVPVLYEYVPRRYVTYWIFFPWSTVPYRLVELERGDRPRGVGDIDTASILEELAVAYPDLGPRIAEAARREAEAEGARGLDDLGGWFRSQWELWQGRKHLIASWPRVHQGDWERISVRLDERETMVQVAYYAHAGRGLRDVPASERGKRPTVYVALGSHASYADTKQPLKRGQLVKALEILGGKEPWDVAPGQLVDARGEEWFGFGGAWGRDGADRDQTGPLGPSEYKDPSPFD